MKTSKRRFAALISGPASTAAAIFKACDTAQLPDVEFILAIASNFGAGQALREFPDGPPIAFIRKKDFSNDSGLFGAAILDKLANYSIDIVGQHGWNPTTPPNVIDAFPRRLYNQHPDLVPWFGGSGMTGQRVTCASLNFRRETDRPFYAEPCAHWVTPELDAGRMIHTGRVGIEITDTCETLYARVKNMECQVQIETLRMICDGTVTEVSVDPPSRSEVEEQILARVKQQAIAHHPGH